jgi:hypothetical protein
MLPSTINITSTLLASISKLLYVALAFINFWCAKTTLAPSMSNAFWASFNDSYNPSAYSIFSLHESVYVISDGKSFTLLMNRLTAIDSNSFSALIRLL